MRSAEGAALELAGDKDARAFETASLFVVIIAYCLWGVKSAAPSWIVAAGIIVAAFIISAASGIMNGIRILSSVNSRLYILLGIFVFICGPSAYIMDLLVESIGLYLNDFIKISLWTSTTSGDAWSRWWPTFYWCNWMAWMPVTSVFLGRVCRGYSVREAINVIFIFPSVFSIIWLVLFSGTAINFEYAELGINAVMRAGGTPEGTTYALFRLSGGGFSIWRNVSGGGADLWENRKTRNYHH